MTPAQRDKQRAIDRQEEVIVLVHKTLDLLNAMEWIDGEVCAGYVARMDHLEHGEGAFEGEIGYGPVVAGLVAFAQARANENDAEVQTRADMVDRAVRSVKV